MQSFSVLLEGIDIFTGSPLDVHWTLRGKGARESQELDVRVGESTTKPK